jgi:hypothetical protein
MDFVIIETQVLPIDPRVVPTANCVFIHYVRPVKPAKHSGNYMYHMLKHSITLAFAYRVYLCVSYASQNEQRFFFLKHQSVELCNGDALCFLRGTDWYLNIVR